MSIPYTARYETLKYLNSKQSNTVNIQASTMKKAMKYFKFLALNYSSNSYCCY